MLKHSKKIKFHILILCLIFGSSTALFAQKVETIDGIRTVRNDAKGLWGNSPKVELKFEKTIGSMESDDENELLYLPVDVAVDNEGNLYILDEGNFRVQKFDPSGKYLATFGREGQGPGEFKGPTSLDVDKDGNIYVGDEQNKRIQIFSPDGKSKNTIPFNKVVGSLLLSHDERILMAAGRGKISLSLSDSEEKPKAPPLLAEVSNEGEIKRTFGLPFEYDNDMANNRGNLFQFAVDGDDNVYVSFKNRNRIDKYTKKGTPVLRIERKLNYEEILPPKKGTSMSVSGAGKHAQSISDMPVFVDISYGIGVDSKGRIWVATANRPHKEEEEAGRSISVSMVGGEMKMGVSVQGATDVIETDIFKLEIFAPTGELLGEIPLTHFCDGMRIFGNKLYIIDELRGMQIYEYTIVDL